MISFLNSIKIDNIDSFDIDFEMVSRNRFNHEQIDMIIVKDTPWEYHLLREFQDALINNVNYPYFMRFSYKEKPSFDNLVNLFNDWHQTIYRLPPDITLLDGGEGIINIEYDNEDIKSKNELMIKDFKDFLSFITYDFTIKESVKPQEEKVIISEKKLAKIIEKASDEASIAIEESKDEAPINDRDDVKEMIELEKAANNAVMEDFLLKQKIENTKQMIKERERARLNRHGDYKHIPLIDSISSNSGNIDIDGYVFYKEVKDFVLLGLDILKMIKKYRKDGDYLKNDPRITKIGHFIRKTSLDELPQLFNILKGDISLIGPRALLPNEHRTYGDRSLILTVKSGLTGLAQVSGRRDISFEERRSLDIYYVKNWSLTMDLQIFFKTIATVFKGEGAK